ncbi:MAG TPA: MCP four helix bundle domain-containing protein, partial [Niallia sp.]|nr:MCP four helix bundle domain-containing protein [Niallia sp.]
MSIKKKLFLSFGSIIFILIGLSAFSVIKISSINSDYTFLIDDRSYKVIEASKVQNATSLQGLYLRSYVLRQDSTDLDSLYNQRETVSEIINEIEPLFIIEQMKDEIKNIKEQQTLYNDYVDQIIIYVDNNQQDKALNMLFNFAVPANKSIQQSINNLVDFQTELMKTSQTDTTASAANSKVLLIVISVVSSLLVIVLAVLIIRNITNPLKRLTNSANVIATGDLR